MYVCKHDGYIVHPRHSKLNFQMIDYSKFTPICVGAIQEIHAKVEKQELTISNIMEKLDKQQIQIEKMQELIDKQYDIINLLMNRIEYIN